MNLSLDAITDLADKANNDARRASYKMLVAKGFSKSEAREMSIAQGHAAAAAIFDSHDL